MFARNYKRAEQGYFCPTAKRPKVDDFCLLAIKLANPKKSLESAINYLCHEIQKSGMCIVDDQTELSILLHFYDEDSIEDGGTPINCNIVVSKPELSDEDKAELKEQAMEQFKD